MDLGRQGGVGVSVEEGNQDQPHRQGLPTEIGGAWYEERRERGDLIHAYKVITGKD